MPSQWYYLIGQTQHGPVRSRQLFRLAREGTVTPDTLVWKPGISDWVKASKIRKLFEDAPPAPAPGIVPGKSSRRNPAVPETAVNEPVRNTGRKPLTESLSGGEQPRAAGDEEDIEVLTDPEVIEDEGEAQAAPPADAPATQPAAEQVGTDEDAETISPQVVGDEASPSPLLDEPAAEDVPAPPTEESLDQPDVVEDAPPPQMNEALSDLVNALQSSNREPRPKPRDREKA